MNQGIPGRHRIREWGNPVPGVKNVKEEEKKPTGWEVGDPKPPVIQSGHMENRRENK